MTTPVLFMIFNRPDTTERVFEAIRAARPERLYVAADGPRAERGDEEAELCRRTREVVLSRIDWPCAVKTLFQDQNLGCGMAPYTAMQWFFEHEPEGIILEDDCLPHPDFFGYCTEMLEKYRDNPRIKVVAGTNHDFYQKSTNESYYFSVYPHIWGWAAWRKTWEGYRFDLTNVSHCKLEKALRRNFDTFQERMMWRYMYLHMRYELLKNGNRISFWDYQLTMALWQNNALNIIPNRAMIQNIGFGQGATHTIAEDSQTTNRPPESILPLVHPTQIVRNKEYDLLYVQNRLYWRRLPLSYIKLWARYILLKLKKR